MTAEPNPVLPPLPPREPRPALVHFLVDSAVAFLAVLIFGLFLGIPWGLLVVLGLMLGGALTPYTRRLEARQLADRAGE